MNEFDMLIETVSLGEKIGHMFLVDIRLDHKKGEPKKLMQMNFIFASLKS